MKKIKNWLLCLSAVGLIVGCSNHNNSDSGNQSDSITPSNQPSSGNDSSINGSQNSEISSSENVDKKIMMTGMTMPESFVEYGNNKIGNTLNEKAKFLVLDRDYKVGDDNAFRVKPDLTFVEYDPIKEEINEIDIDTWEFSITIYRLVNEQFVIEESSEYVDSIDYENCFIDFSEKAINQTFKIEVVPEGLTENQQANIDKWTMSVEVDVIDGYNVYNAKEFAYINNTKTNLSSSSSNQTISAQEIWSSFKQNNDLLEDYYPNNLILQQNISIKNSDIPTQYFFSEDEVSKSDIDYNRVVGSLKDYNNLYFRELSSNESFHLYGNYFSIDASNISLVVRDGKEPTAEGDTIISHATLFRVEGDDTTSSSFNDINFVGNSPRQENETLSGGLIMNKIEGPEFKAYNNITKCWFISYMPNRTNQPYTMDSCRAYDNFNSFVYNWGSQNVKIKNSEFIGAGGPVIIQDHVGHDNNGQGGYAPQTIIENSNIQSYVTGDEGWFKIVGASALVPQIKALDAIFTPANRSFLKSNSDKTNTLFNLICVNKSGSAESITASKISGELKIDNEDTHYTFNYGKENPMVSGLCNNDLLLKNGAPIFETSAGGASYFNGTNLLDALQNPITSLTDNMFNGNYLCTYSSGMALIFGYGPAGEVYNPTSMD